MMIKMIKDDDDDKDDDNNNDKNKENYDLWRSSGLNL